MSLSYKDKTGLVCDLCICARPCSRKENYLVKSLLVDISKWIRKSLIGLNDWLIDWLIDWLTDWLIDISNDYHRTTQTTDLAGGCLH